MPVGHSFSLGTFLVLLSGLQMSIVKVVLERLGGVSSIRWTARGPANSERSKCWPFTTTFLQSRETAVAVVAERRNRAGNDPSMPCAHMAIGSCRKSRRLGYVERRLGGSVTTRSTEQETEKVGAVQGTITVRRGN